MSTSVHSNDGFRAIFNKISMGGGKNDSPTLPVALAYAALVGKGIEGLEPNAVEIDSEQEDHGALIAELAQEFDAEDLKAFVLGFDPVEHYGRFAGEYNTPESLCNLASAILGIADGDGVADLGCGYGSFLVNVASKADPSLLYGIDLDASAVRIAKMKMAVMGRKADIVQGDMLEAEPPQKFDKAFSNFPFGMRQAFAKDESAHRGVFRSGVGSIGRPLLADWVFNKCVFDMLAEDGKAVTVVSNGAAFNGGDAMARKHFIDNGMIRAVVALPERMFFATGIGTTMLVLGKNEGAVRMVDATDLAVPGRRRNTLDEGGIADIVGRLENDGDRSRLVSAAELAEADYILFPLRYLGRDLKLVNPVSFGSVIESVERGASIRASELDKMETDADTGFKYLKLSDIADGRIGSKLSNLVALDDSTKRQWLHTGDLVISKNGAPFKVAVADVAEGDAVLANGNLYIVRVDEEQVNPYYIAAFLASDDGKEALSRMAVGTSIPNLPVRNLKDMQIPLLPREQQDEVARRYRASLDEVEALKAKIAEARRAAAEAYDAVSAHWESQA